MGNEIITVSTDKYRYGFNSLSSGEEGVHFEVEYLDRIHETDDTQYLHGPDFSELIGKKVTFVLSSTGEASEFEGFAELPEVVIADEQRELNEHLYIIDLRELFPGLPEEERGIGDSWTVMLEYEEPVCESRLIVKIEFLYTVKGTDKIGGHDCLVVDGTYNVLVTGNPTLGGVDMIVKMEGEGTESFTFALERGMFLHSSGKLAMDGTAVNEEVGLSLLFKHTYETEIKTSFE